MGVGCQWWAGVRAQYFTDSGNGSRWVNCSNVSIRAGLRLLHMHGELGAPEEDPASLISVADRITVTVTEFSNTTSITDRWRNKEDRALGSSDRGVGFRVLHFGIRARYAGTLFWVGDTNLMVIAAVTVIVIVNWFNDYEMSCSLIHKNDSGARIWIIKSFDVCSHSPLFPLSRKHPLPHPSIFGELRPPSVLLPCRTPPSPFCSPTLHNQNPAPIVVFRAAVCEIYPRTHLDLPRFPFAPLSSVFASAAVALICHRHCGNRPSQSSRHRLLRLEVLSPPPRAGWVEEPKSLKLDGCGLLVVGWCESPVCVNRTCEPKPKQFWTEPPDLNRTGLDLGPDPLTLTRTRPVDRTLLTLETEAVELIVRMCLLHMHGELGASEEDPASLISVADRITVTVTEFSNTTSITDRWRNKEDRALGSSDRGVLTVLIRFGDGISSRSRDTVFSNVIYMVSYTFIEFCNCVFDFCFRY
ncbi:hypothetical protein GQ457_08G017840 [Hibiscus cannabinus]